MKLVRSSDTPETSRAEQTRQRRITTSQKRTKEVKRNLTQPPRGPASAPVVTVRSSRTTRGMASAPVAAKGRGKPRRQFYYTLDTTGAEVRLPSVPVIHPGWRLLSGALVLVLAFFIYLAYNDARFQVGPVEFDGLKRLKAAEVSEVLDLNNLPIFMVDPEEIKSLLAISFPELADVKVVTGLPAVLKISVTERQPILAWKTGEQTYWVDKTGYIFPARGDADKIVRIEADATPPILMTDIPLTGSEEELAGAQKEKNPRLEIIGQTLDPQMLTAAQVLSKKMPAEATLIYTLKDGLGWSDPGGWNVYVGMDLSNINLKLKVYQAVIQKLEEDGITPVLVSVENVNAPFYRLE